MSFVFLADKRVLVWYESLLFFFFKQKTAYEMLRSLVGSEICIRDSKGTKANDTFMTIVQTAKKLGVSAYDYIFDRVSNKFEMLSLAQLILSLIHISEPTRLLSISYAVFCLKKKKTKKQKTQ